MNNKLSHQYTFCMNNELLFMVPGLPGIHIRGNSRSIKIIENLGSMPPMTNHLWIQHTRLRENLKMKKNAQFLKSRFKNSTVQFQTYISKLSYLVIIQQISEMHELHPFDTCTQTVCVRMNILATRSKDLHQYIIS